MKKIVAAVVVIVVIPLVGFGAWHLMDHTTTSSGTPEPVTIGVMPVGSSALIYISEDRGFFARNGLNVTIQDYSSGLTAVNGLLADDVDVSVSTEYPIVGKAFKIDNISIITSIDKYKTVYLIGRQDRGLENVSDLRGKRIGVVRGTILEFYLGRYLDLHGISIQDVTPVDLQPSQYVDAIANGSVDAVMAEDVFIDPIKERLGSNVVLWPAQNQQEAFWTINCRDNWLSSHPETINKLLRSLDQAEEYSVIHPDESKAIVQKRLNYTDAYMVTLWQDHQFSLSLDQSLLIAMNDEGRWMINNNLTSEKALPNYGNYIYTKGLEAVKPNVVNIR